MELDQLKKTLIEVETLIDQAQTVTEDEMPQSEKDATLNLLESTKISLDRAIKNVEEVENKQELVKIAVPELQEQMEASSLYKNLSEETQAQIIHKIINNTQYKILSDQEFREYVAKELSTLETKELIQKAYTKDEIIRAGQNVAKESNDQVKYEEGINFLRGMSDTPEAFQDLLSLAFKGVIKNNDDLLMYLKSYYGI